MASRSPRLDSFLFLSREEVRRLERAAAAELRTPGGYVTRLVLAELDQKRPVEVRPPRAGRVRYDVHLRLTETQRKALERRAQEEGQSAANLVTAIVVRELGEADGTDEAGPGLP